MASLTNKVAIVTGASSGIGAATALEMARRGMKVVLAARTAAKLQALSEKISALGADSLIVETDVSVEADCKRMVAETIAQFGQVDVLINNAGISMRALFNELELDVIRNLMETNFWGTVYATKYALPHLLKTKGSVVGVSSIAGYRGLPARTGYSASKFAMQGFLEALRTENLKTGLHVMWICPGFTASNIRKAALTADGNQQGDTPRKENKMMSSEEVARHMVNGVQKRKRTIVLTSTGKLTVFLNKWIPGIMDGLVYNNLAKEPDSPFK